MSLDPTTHIIFFAIEAWGHTRALCTMALRLFEERPLYITFFTASTFVKRVENGISRSFGPDTEHLRDLVRVVGLKSLPKDLAIDKGFSASMEMFADVYQKIVDGQPVTCSVTGKEIDPRMHPDALIMDFLCTPALKAARKISKKPVKIYAWISSQTTFTIYQNAPERWGGIGDLLPKVMGEVKSNGRPLSEVANEMLILPTGSVVRLPGIPLMYDYELKPQAVPAIWMDIRGLATVMAISYLDQCDGLILSTAEPYESEAIAHITGWYGETSREVYTFGHLLPINENAAAGEQKQSDQADEISGFLQKTIETDGPGSLLNISFGSFSWPTNPEKVWAFLDVVMEKNIPFIFSHGSPFSAIPDEVIKKVNTYGRGLLSKWSPQQTILAHPATGWFVTHCGQNSVMEAITLGVPMICWPFDADQPTGSARLSFVLDVAYELFEVRTEPYGLKPIHRLGKAPLGTIEAVCNEARTILDSAFGEDGARKRANMKNLQAAVLNTWSENGPARRDLRRFVATLQK